MNKTVDESKTVNTGYVIFTPVELVEKFDNVEMRSVKDSYGNMIHTPFYKNQQVYLKLTGHSGHISEVSADSGNVYAFTQMYRLGTKSDTEKPSEQLQALLDFDARFSENVSESCDVPYKPIVAASTFESTTVYGASVKLDKDTGLGRDRFTIACTVFGKDKNRPYELTNRNIKSRMPKDVKSLVVAELDFYFSERSFKARLKARQIQQQDAINVKPKFNVKLAL